MSGSNRAREFSAWQEGWAHLRASGVSPDIVVLTNDTFPFHQPYRLLAPLLRISLQKLLESGRRRWALGVVERGFAYQHLSQYLTSFFVVLEKEAASLVMDSLTEPVSDWQVAPDAASGKIIHSRDKQYEESINRWLLAPASRSWYGAAPLTGTNYTAMAGKARSIVLEHGLSRRLQDGDAHLVSCFDLPFGFLARWYCRIDERRRTNKWFAKTHVA